MPNNNQNIQDATLRVLNYFNFFQYPLSINQIHSFIDVKCTIYEIQAILNDLIHNKIIFLINGNYLLVNERYLVERKEKGYHKAKKVLEKAKFISKILATFPFVRMVAISGSLSKGYADKKTDIDYFIVTTENNLWTCRTILHLFKKLTFLIRMQHSFCMNYFISENHLELEEKNYFTAVELATLITIYSNSESLNMVKSNPWIKEFLPNFSLSQKVVLPNKRGPLKYIMEMILSSKKLNKWLMNYTDRRWKKKWKKKGYSKSDYELAFKTTLFVSKNHPKNYQKRILDKLNKNNLNG